MAKKKLSVSIPNEPTQLEQDAIDLYSSASKFAKSGVAFQLMEGGVVLKKLGLLEYVIGLASAKDINGSAKQDVEDLLKSKLSTDRGRLGAEDRSKDVVTPNVSDSSEHSAAKMSTPTNKEETPPMQQKKKAELSYEGAPTLFKKDGGLGGIMSLETGG